MPRLWHKKHEDFLKAFFTSKNKDKVAYRDLLLNLMDKPPLKHTINIRLGIPCCNCFKEIFPTPQIEMDELRAQSKKILGKYDYSIQEKAINFYLDLLEFDPNLDFTFIAHKLKQDLNSET